MEKVVIIGSGPAGYTAAIYTARACLSPLVFAGSAPGGQAALSSEIGNYPGFAEDISGAELTGRMQRQAERFGARIEMDIVTGVDLARRPLKVTAYGGEFETMALIVASGASPRRLGVPGEAELAGQGVSYCATCDGFFYAGKSVAVIGGGDSAIEEALFLTRYATQVTIVHRRNQLRAEPFLQERAFKNEKIRFIWDTVVSEVVGSESVTGLQLHNVRTGEKSLYPTEGIFVSIGHVPNTAFLGRQLALTEHGYVVVDEHGRTSVEGVWAAGDVADWTYRQIATSVGSGCRAALQVEQYIARLEDRAYPGSAPEKQGKGPATTGSEHAARRKKPGTRGRAKKAEGKVSQ